MCLHVSILEVVWLSVWPMPYFMVCRASKKISGQPHLDADMTRGHLRKVIAALSQSDAFIDVLARELFSAGISSGGDLQQKRTWTEEDSKEKAQDL